MIICSHSLLKLKKSCRARDCYLSDMLCPQKILTKHFIGGNNRTTRKRSNLWDFRFSNPNLFPLDPFFQNPKILKSFRPESPEIIRNLRYLKVTLNLIFSVKKFVQTKIFSVETFSSIETFFRTKNNFLGSDLRL